MWMSALPTAVDVNTHARTSWGLSSAAARLDTSWMRTEGAVSVSASSLRCGGEGELSLTLLPPAEPGPAQATAH